MEINRIGLQHIETVNEVQFCVFIGVADMAEKQYGMGNYNA